MYEYTPQPDCVEIPVKFFPYASRFYLFKSDRAQIRLRVSTLEEVRGLSERELTGLASSNGLVKVSAISADRKITGSTLVRGLPAPYTLAGTWKMELEGYKFEKVVEQMQQLRSWTEDPRTKTFSGTGHYSLSFEPPEGFLDADSEVYLDLGVVGNVAAVEVNGQHAGVVWMRPYTVHVTELLHAGENRVEVRVTNTLINHVSQLDELPGVPEALVPHYGKTAHIYKLGAGIWEHREKDFSPLPSSGLLGPVIMFARRRVKVELS